MTQYIMIQYHHLISSWEEVGRDERRKAEISPEEWKPKARLNLETKPVLDRLL